MIPSPTKRKFQPWPMGQMSQWTCFFETSDDDSSSSSDASSPIVDEEALEFMAANKLCADQQLFYSNNGLSDGFTRRGIYPLNLDCLSAKAIRVPVSSTTMIDKNIFRTQEADEVFVPNGLDLVPWRLVVHAVMLKVLAENLQLSEESSISPTKQLAAI
jgi:hypothetical protein